MFTSEMLRLFPRRRIKPLDGMAVTAEVWEEAHEYHRQLGRFHALLMHGAGVVTGLEVIASEPPDNSVYILPGIAIDPIGQTIVLPEPRAYDLGRSEGILYLIVTYNESRPQVAGVRAEEDTPRYVHEQFLLEAVTELPQTPYVELARIRRQRRNEGQLGPIRNAANRNHPRADEIDLRFRRQIGVQEQKQAAVGVVTLPGVGSEHAEGMENVAHNIQHHTGGLVWVDTQVRLEGALDEFDLLYVVGGDNVSLSSEQMNAVYQYLRAGGVIFYESCRRGVDQGEPGGDRAWRELMDSMGIELKSVGRGHPLLRRPLMFGQMPDGYETRGAPMLEAGNLEAGRVVFSTFDYGCMWTGERRGRPATRSEIRNALEWAENLLAFALENRASAPRGGQDRENDAEANGDGRDRAASGGSTSDSSGNGNGGSVAA